MISNNLNRLRVIAEGLGELCRDVVFVGGSVVELYADDPAELSRGNRMYAALWRL